MYPKPFLQAHYIFVQHVYTVVVLVFCSAGTGEWVGENAVMKGWDVRWIGICGVYSLEGVLEPPTSAHVCRDRSQHPWVIVPLCSDPEIGGS